MKRSQPKTPKEVKDSWKRGETAYFEYHCLQSCESGDYPVWLRSQQAVQVVGVVEPGNGKSFMDRAETGQPRVYSVLFSDGLEWDVFEDELLTSPRYYQEMYGPPSHRRLDR